MKRNVIFLLLLPALFLLSGCENTMDQGDETSLRTFTATIEGGEPSTKTLLENVAVTAPRNVLWKDGDAVIVGGATYTAGSLRNGGRTAVLSGSGATPGSDGKYRGYYPTDLYFDATRVNLPQTQNYEAPSSADGNRVVAAHLPMYAESTTTDLPFKNLCAVLSLKLTGTKTVTSIRVQSSDGPLGGVFTVDWNGGDPTLSSPLSSKYYVDLSLPGSGVQLSDTPVEFCIAIRPGTYAQSKLTVRVYNGSYVVALYTNQNAPAAGSVFERSKIYDLTTDTDWVRMTATTDGHQVGGNYADGTTTNLNSTWTK